MEKEKDVVRGPPPRNNSDGNEGKRGDRGNGWWGEGSGGVDGGEMCFFGFDSKNPRQVVQWPKFEHSRPILAIVNSLEQYFGHMNIHM